MVKVLIYSSEEIYNNSSYDGRAEADIVAYRKNEVYVILKNRTSQYMPKEVIHFTMERMLQWAERDEWNRDKDSQDLIERYKNHPYMELMKNESI